MIYCDVSPSEPLSQGDILDECPLLFWQASGTGEQMEPVTRPVRVVVLTQACDLAQLKANRILVACVHSARELVERNVLQGRVIRDQIRTHRVYGWYFLPGGPALSESIVLAPGTLPGPPRLGHQEADDAVGPSTTTGVVDKPGSARCW